MIKDEQAKIIEERCIGCGQCMKICPQDARNIKSDLHRVKRALKDHKKVIVSIAPSFSGFFKVDNPYKIISGIRRLGFNIIEETAIGAEVVTNLYREYIKDKEPENIITTSCPSSCYLIEQYYPSLVPYMIPIVSPMLAHGKILRQTYGMDSFVIFIGPCITKKIEAANFQHNSVIDAVLTFDEVSEWFTAEDIDLNTLEPGEMDKNSANGGAIYPLKGGVIRNLLQGELKDKYTLISVDGIEDCMEVFKSLENKNVKNLCIEAHTCKGSCIGGSAISCEEVDFYQRKIKVQRYVSEKTKDIEYLDINKYKNINFIKRFFDKTINNSNIPEEEIEKTLETMGKYSKADELNCGACGYDTCRDKAVGIIQGMAEMNMCLPYMRSKAESLKDLIFEKSPNAIILMDETLNVKEFNPSAEKIFNIKLNDIKDRPISIILDEEVYCKVRDSKGSIFKSKSYYKEYEKVFIENILYLENHRAILAIMIDVTKDESNQTELNRVKEKTIDAAQSVIEKQMRVAHEIASLLGETTAETKMILTKLKNITKGETGDL